MSKRSTRHSTFTIERINGTIGSVDVTLQLAPGAGNGANAQDFAGVMNLPSNVTVTIPAGQTSATVTINVAGDAVFEANENFTATITNATTTPQRHRRGQRPPACRHRPDRGPLPPKHRGPGNQARSDVVRPDRRRAARCCHG